jgi:hypothetical protein
MHEILWAARRYSEKESAKLYRRRKQKIEMTDDEQFAVWLAGMTLRAADREIAALTLDDLSSQAEQGKGLSAALADMQHFDRSGGDFGAEIIGPLLIPVLIGVGKQLWAAYLKDITGKAASGLADLTAKSAKDYLKRHWSRENAPVVAEYERLLRAAATKQGLGEQQIDELVAAVRGPGMVREVAAT